MIRIRVIGADVASSRLAGLSIACQIAGGASFLVGPRVNYGRHVEMGTHPHIIRPRNKKALFWKGAKHPVKSVNHPGTKAQPYLVPALMQMRPSIRRRVVAAEAAVIAGGSSGLIRQAVQAGAFDVQAQAQRNVKVKTGTLRRSIHTRSVT